MRALFIGILSEGTTSKLRSTALSAVTSGWQWDHLDTDHIFLNSSRWSRSLAFRLRIGPVIAKMNLAVKRAISNRRYDLIWVDKGVYFWPKTVNRLRQCAKRLVHYTPDTAFLRNRSRFFASTAHLYDLLVTTKSFELADYHRLVPKDRVLLTTQSYDSTLHRPRHEFHDKLPEAVFVGLCEPARETCIEHLLAAGIPVRLGGQGWQDFVDRHRGNSFLRYHGSRLFGDLYAETLSRSRVGLGLLSKQFPELHTTRTFEIPACGTALVTERNQETRSWFDEEEAIFFDRYDDMVGTLKNLWNKPEALELIASRGHRRVQSNGCDNQTIVKSILGRLSVPEEL